MRLGIFGLLAVALLAALWLRPAPTVPSVTVPAGAPQETALPMAEAVPEPATLVFTAEHAGRFEIELHHRHAGIGALEVSPH